MLHILQLKSFCSVCFFFLACLVKLHCLLNVFPQVTQEKLFFVLRSLDEEAVSPSEDKPALLTERNKIGIKYNFFYNFKWNIQLK